MRPAGPGEAGLVIDDVSINEGGAGSTTVQVTVALTSTHDQPAEVTYGTADGTATLADADYQAATGKAQILVGSLTADISLQVVGDVKYEADEQVYVKLSNAVNAVIVDAQATVAILNDDEELPGGGGGDPTVFLPLLSKGP